jgi:2-methylcitrate dehydratase PrpD
VIKSTPSRPASYGGLPARNGVTSAILVQSGFTGVSDPFCGQNKFFKAYSATPNPNPDLLIEGLGSDYEIMFGCIKQFSVGSPIQGPLNALLLLIEKHGLRAKDVDRMIATTYGEGAKVVDNREMPDINLQHILALTLVDGGLTFKSSHSFERMNDPAVLALKKRITLVGDPGFGTTKRQGIVEITTKDGAKLREHVVSPRGMMENPMTTEEVEKKCRDLLEPVLGQDHSRELIDGIWNLERISNMRTLRPLLSA